MSRIYTKQGDAGTSAVLEGGRQPKHAPVFLAIGELDELNAHLGLCLTGTHGSRRKQLEAIQSALFAIGAQLASNSATDYGVTPAATTELESWIDADWRALPPLRRFILPGGTPLGAQLHLARAVARRAERALSALHTTNTVAPSSLMYLNRLSDYLFAAARAENAAARQPERTWTYES